MSGGSRGIGLAIAVEAGRLGANVVLLAKTDKEDPRLGGTVHTAVAAIEAAGGHGLAVVGDVRNDADVDRAVDAATGRFGGIDIVVNNASALTLAGTEELTVKRFDLMQQVNSRGTYLLTRAALPHLKQSEHARVLTLSPPLNLAPHWLGRFPGYMLSKYGMTLLTLGWAAEFANVGIAANCLWPQSTIATAAVVNLLGGQAAAARARSPQIMADAAVAVLRLPTDRTGETFLDVDILAESGVVDLARYGGGHQPEVDYFVDGR
jgi:NAD(P)-dependent dehydrogenase (short-subunit alcohol dehydrogenase family)